MSVAPTNFQIVIVSLKKKYETINSPTIVRENIMELATCNGISFKLSVNKTEFSKPKTNPPIKKPHFFDGVASLIADKLKPTLVKTFAKMALYKKTYFIFLNFDKMKIEILIALFTI